MSAKTASEAAASLTMLNPLPVPSGRAEEDYYWSLLESTQKHQYPDFVKNLSSQDGPMREEGQAAVIEFQDGAKPSVQKLPTSRVLQSYLNNPRPAGTARRRAFVLEGLPRNFVVALGAKLRAPPAFFASHWASPGQFSGSVLNRTPRHYDSRTRFIMSFPRVHQARIKEPNKNIRDPLYFMESSVSRLLSGITVFGELDGPLSSMEQLSFWSVCNGESWDAIILVDPPLRKYVGLVGSNIPREVERGDSIQFATPGKEGYYQQSIWHSLSTCSAVLGPTPTEWEKVEQIPSMESMFKDICLLYPLRERQLTADPGSCVDICRRLVLSSWTVRLRVMEAQIIQEQFRISLGDLEGQGSVKNWRDKTWALPWHARDFGRLVRAKSTLELHDAELLLNMDALGLFSDGQDGESVGGWEAAAWRSMHRAVQGFKAQVDISSQAYIQAVSVREAITSNKQARQVGYLTSLATLFIPLSFVAAIFSMGGEYSVGAELFWVYWVIAAPMATLGCILLYTRLGRRILGHASEDEPLV